MRVLLAGVLAALLAGCASYERGRFSAVSTAPLDMPVTVIAQEVQGRFCAGAESPTHQLAVANALEQAPGANALVNAVFDADPLCTIVRGTAVRVERPTPPSPGP